MSLLNKITTHVLACQHETCASQGAKASLREFKHALKEQGLREQVLITKIKCLDQCGRGPVLVVYPEGVWYGGVDESCARRIAEQHIGEGRVAEGCTILRDMREEAEPETTAPRTVVVGDIHGCYDELLALVEKVGLRADDRLVCVGDLIVKGKQNREVLDLFISDARFSSVLGNHDRAILRYWNGEPLKLKASQKKCAAELEPGRERYHAYLKSLPLMLDLGTHLVVHAGVRPGVALREQSAEDLTELRTLGADPASRAGTPWYEVYDGEKIVLFGHWPADKPRGGPRAIGLDSGCVYGYKLTAYIIETGEFVRVSARRAKTKGKDAKAGR